MLTFKSKILCTGLACLTLFWSFAPYLCAQNPLNVLESISAKPESEAAPMPTDEAADAVVVSADGMAPVSAEDMASVPDSAGDITEHLVAVDVLVGKIFTVPEGEDHYVAYGNVHGTFMSGDKVVADFVSDAEGMFEIESLPPGDYTLMAEQERDKLFGSAQVTVAYSSPHEEAMVLFLNKHGLARFPLDFDPSIPLAENNIKYWQFVGTGRIGVSQGAVNNVPIGSHAVSAYSTANMAGYPAAGMSGGMSMGFGFGALGLLGLIGLIGIGPSPVSEK